MRAVSPRSAFAAFVCTFAGIPMLSAMAENRPSELKLRVVPPAVERPVVSAPVQVAAPVVEEEPVIQQMAFEEVEAASKGKLPATNALHQEIAEEPAAATPPLVRRPPIFPGRPPIVQMPRRMTIQSAPQRSARRTAKPFGEHQPEPTISPYLNMYRDESEDEGVPNYFAFVRPVFEQQELNRTQQMELQQLRGQLQNVSSGTGSMPATGLRARYMDTAQFYNGRNNR